MSFFFSDTWARLWRSFFGQESLDSSSVLIFPRFPAVYCAVTVAISTHKNVKNEITSKQKNTNIALYYSLTDREDHFLQEIRMNQSCHIQHFQVVVSLNSVYERIVRVGEEFGGWRLVTKGITKRHPMIA